MDFMLTFYCLFCLVYVRILFSFIGWHERKSHPLCARAFLPVPWHWIPSRSVREPSGAVSIPP